MSKNSEKEVSSVCILRLSAIGDVCNACAIVQEIQRQKPHINLTWVIGKVERTVFSHLDGVNFVVFDKNDGLRAYIKLFHELRKQNFDVLLHMQSSFRSSLASLCLRAERKIGFDRERARELQWLFTTEKILPQKQPHVVDGFKNFALKLGLNNFNPKWNIKPETNLREWVKTATNNQPFVVLSPSASNTERNWDTENYRKVIQYLLDKNLLVVLTSGPSPHEKLLINNVQAGFEKKILNLAGKTNMQELLALISLSLFVVSPDSGPVHIASMLNIPVIGLYAHSNPERTGPWRYRDLTVNHYPSNIEKQQGKPIENIAWGKRAKGDALMSLIQVEEVTEKISRLLQQLEPRKFPGNAR